MTDEAGQAPVTAPTVAPSAPRAPLATATPPAIAGTLLAGLRALLLLKPEARLRLRPATQFWWLVLLNLLLSLLVQAAETPMPWLVNPDGLRSDATTVLLLLGLAHGAAHLARQPPRSWTLAILLMAAYCVLSLVAPALQWLAARQDLDATLVFAVLCSWWGLIVLRVGWHVLAGPTPVWRRLCGPALLGLLTCLSWLFLTQERYLYTDNSSEWAEDSTPAPEPPQVQGSAEQLLYAQPRLLDHALARIRRSEPGQPELFVLAFGGDGNEQVFLNEVEYVERLFSTRFAATQRILKLVNSVHTTTRLPLATLTNLQRALLALGDLMDSEDVLFLYLTSHGSEDHQLFVNLLPLPLDQITPEDLAEALREAEIGPRVVLVSACYSGGFIDALADPRALVMTAARSDRPSFGCGTEADITYFGRAFLVEALNQERDFRKAFLLARRRVTAREKAENHKPSRPQVSEGVAIGAVLDAWLATLPPTPSEALPFETAAVEATP